MWPKYWSFNLSLSPSSEYSGLISFKMDWLDLLAVQGTLKSVLQNHSSKASILRHSTLFIVQISCPLSWWCHPTISSSVILIYSCPASGSLTVSQFFASCGQSIGVSASASVLSVNIQGWLLFKLTGWISLVSKGLSGVFSNTTFQKLQFSGSHISLYLLEHLK